MDLHINQYIALTAVNHKYHRHESNNKNTRPSDAGILMFFKHSPQTNFSNLLSFRFRDGVSVACGQLLQPGALLSNRGGSYFEKLDSLATRSSPGMTMILYTSYPRRSSAELLKHFPILINHLGPVGLSEWTEYFMRPQGDSVLMSSPNPQYFRVNFKPGSFFARSKKAQARKNQFPKNSRQGPL